jgi:hypothetical protein
MEMHDAFIRMPKTLFGDLKRLAEFHERSVTGEVVWALKQHVRQHRRELSGDDDGKGGKGKTRQ